MKALGAACIVLTTALTLGLTTALPADQSKGKATFARVCARCHGGAGEGGDGPALVPMYLTRDDVFGVVRGGQAKMPAVPEATISDDEIGAVFEYLSSLSK